MKISIVFNSIVLFATRSFLLFLLVCCTFQCSREEEALVTFDGGDVRRWELEVALKATGGNHVNSISNDQKASILKRIALIKIAALEGEKLSLDKTDTYKKLTAMLAENVQIDTYEDYLRKKAPHLIFQMMEIQHIFLKENKDSDGKIIARQKEVEEILAKLNSGKMTEAEIEGFIVEKTEEPALQATAGNDLPICLNCTGNRKVEMTTTIQKSPLNQFVSVEKTGAGIWIARKLQEKSVDEDDLQTYFINYYSRRNQIVKKHLINSKDENQRQIASDKLLLKEKQILASSEETVKNYLHAEKKRSPLEIRIEELQKKVNFKMENTISFHGEKKMGAEDFKEDMKIYSIGNKSFTYGDLKKRFPSEKFELSEQLKQVGKLIEYDILMYDDEFKKMVDTDFYKKVLHARKSRALADTYKLQHKVNATIDSANGQNPLAELEKKYKLTVISSKI